jgi:hypothetical protein
MFKLKKWLRLIPSELISQTRRVIILKCSYFGNLVKFKLLKRKRNYFKQTKASRVSRINNQHYPLKYIMLIFFKTWVRIY